MRWRAGLRFVRVELGLLLLYAFTRWLFAISTVDDGLLSPDGGVSLGVVGLGLLVIVLRVGVLFGVPAILAYRLLFVRRELTRATLEPPAAGSARTGLG